MDLFTAKPLDFEATMKVMFNIILLTWKKKISCFCDKTGENILKIAQNIEETHKKEKNLVFESKQKPDQIIIVNRFSELVAVSSIVDLRILS